MILPRFRRLALGGRRWRGKSPRRPFAENAAGYVEKIVLA
jgi:hypothetical protein